MALSTKAVRLLRRWLAAFCLLAVGCLLAGATGASADEFRTPSISAVRVEWRAVLDQLRSEINAQPSVASAFTFASQRRGGRPHPRALPAPGQLHAITSPAFPRVRRSPRPRLLPFETAS